MPDLVIVGAGGHGRELLDVVEAINLSRPSWDFLGFLDDGEPDAELLARRQAEHLGAVELLAEIEAAYVLAVGSSDIRARLDALATGFGRVAATLVHPLASVASDVTLAAGVVIAAGARVTTNVRLGRHSHLNVNAVVSHDCRVGDFVTISPSATINGNVTIEDGAFLGAAAVVTPGRRLGAGCTVGAGAVVIDDVPPGAVVVGVPARQVQRR